MKDKTVIISDLHIDTWKEDKRVFGKTKLEHFFDFLDWIEPFTSRFVINGDLVEAPPQAGEDLLPTYHKVIFRLIELSKKTKVYYFVGNHDISFWGLKIQDFSNINIYYPYYPNLYIDFGPIENKSYVYLEHGHFYDVVLSLYLYQTLRSIHPKTSIIQRIKRLFLGIFRPREAKKQMVKKGIDVGTLNHAVIRAAQRRDPKTGKKTHPIGVHNWNDYWTDMETSLWKTFTPLVNKYYKPINWQKSAEGVFENFCLEHPGKEIKAVIFGHTHLPDEAKIAYGDKKALYLNSGDWTEPLLEKDPDTHHASFILLDKDGNFERDASGNAVRDFITENPLRKLLTQEPATAASGLHRLTPPKIKTVFS